MPLRHEPRILLIQARHPDDPIIDHEFGCFVARTPLSDDEFVAVNLVEESVDRELIECVDLVVIGGAGDYSIAQRGFDWYDELVDVVEDVLAREIPMFGSCFGFHALVEVLGGRLVTDKERGEIGTYEIALTEAGRRDELFGELPDRFDAQLGHHDAVDVLPDELVCLASSELCTVQAVRVPDKPIYATQFHPELTADDNMERYVRYLKNYKDIDESREEALQRAERIHRSSPEATRLFERFVDQVCGGAASSM